MFRFIHSSDLHLGRRFGNMPEDLRGRLREARHTVIGRLAAHAREHGATAVLLAGDTFDTETPSPEIRRQALAEMAHHDRLLWVLLPGNHDSLQAAQLWSTLRADAPENVLLAVEPSPLPLAPGVFLLPSPCTVRRAGRDLTEWMDAAPTPEGAVRIGLAHGPIQSFSEEDVASNVLAPDRARRAGLDYLALGDWHGTVEVDTRTYYSGTPEPDRFKHDKPGQALVAGIAGAGAAPQVARVQTGAFVWRTVPLHLLPQEDSAALLETALPAGLSRRQTLLRIAALGRTGLAGRAALSAAVEHAAPEFAWLELDDSGLVTDCENDDLDMIDRAGALREAAESLVSAGNDVTLPADRRDVARAALVRLFSYCEKIAR